MSGPMEQCQDKPCTEGDQVVQWIQRIYFQTWPTSLSVDRSQGFAWMPQLPESNFPRVGQRPPRKERPIQAWGTPLLGPMANTRCLFVSKKKKTWARKAYKAFNMCRKSMSNGVVHPLKKQTNELYFSKKKKPLLLCMIEGSENFPFPKTNEVEVINHEKWIWSYPEWNKQRLHLLIHLETTQIRNRKKNRLDLVCKKDHTHEDAKKVDLT